MLELVLSDSLTSRPLTKIALFEKEYFLFTIFSFYDLPDSSKRLIRLSKNGIHDFVGSQGNRLLLDSGGFQLYRKNKALDFHKTLQIYEYAQLKTEDFAVSLDLIPFPDDPEETRKQKIIQSNNIYAAMRAENKKVLPVIHGWNRAEMDLSFQQVRSDDFFCYGSNFPMIVKYKDHTIKDNIIANFALFFQMVREKKLDENRIHILGANGQNSSHICWYAGADQTDSGSWRLKAAFGKICFMGVNEIKISTKEANFGRMTWKDSYDQALRECTCPACLGLSLNDRKLLLADSFKHRCIHNAFIYIQERDLARDLIGTLGYTRYLEKRFKGKWWGKLFTKIRETKHQKEIMQYFKIGDH